MSEPADRILEVACEAGRAAARLCQAVLAQSSDSPEAMSKLGREPVTVADYGSQALILRRVQEAFPEHGVIAEEGAEHLRQQADDRSSQEVVRLVSREVGAATSFEQLCSWIDHHGDAGHEFVWAIDPIDGTKGFLRREQFAVAIGILRDGQPWGGVLACPNLPVHAGGGDAARGVLFVAARGRGATAAALTGGPAQRIEVSQQDEVGPARVLGSVESAHGDPQLVRAVIADLRMQGGMVRIDSQAKYGCVARGDAEVYLRPRSRPDYRENIWDHAAGAVVVEEAGGRVTDLDGQPLDFNRGRRLEANRGVLASNGLLHDRILQSLARVEIGA